jgi:hypothetical protein
VRWLGEQVLWLRTVSFKSRLLDVVRPYSCDLLYSLLLLCESTYIAFDYIKAQMQTELGKAKYKNGLDVLSQTLSTDPLLLYKGVGIQIMGVSPKNGIRLGVNDVIRGGFMGYCGYFPLWGEVVAGCLAGACQVYNDWMEYTTLVVCVCAYVTFISHSFLSICTGHYCQSTRSHQSGFANQ